MKEGNVCVAGFCGISFGRIQAGREVIVAEKTGGQVPDSLGDRKEESSVLPWETCPCDEQPWSSFSR